MPETRYVDVFDGKGKLIAQEPYEVSDEELEQESEHNRIQELVNKSGRTKAESDELADLLASKAGYVLPESKKVRKA